MVENIIIVLVAIHIFSQNCPVFIRSPLLFLRFLILLGLLIFRISLVSSLHIVNQIYYDFLLVSVFSDFDVLSLLTRVVSECIF